MAEVYHVGVTCGAGDVLLHAFTHITSPEIGVCAAFRAECTRATTTHVIAVDGDVPTAC
jgi:hypothetical protein